MKAEPLVPEGISIPRALRAGRTTLEEESLEWTGRRTPATSPSHLKNFRAVVFAHAQLSNVPEYSRAHVKRRCQSC